MRSKYFWYGLAGLMGILGIMFLSVIGITPDQVDTALESIRADTIPPEFQEGIFQVKP